MSALVLVRSQAFLVSFSLRVMKLTDSVSLETPSPPPSAAQAELNFDPAVSAALERIESAATHIRDAQEDLWRLAKSDPALGAVTVELAGVLGAIEGHRYALEEQAGLAGLASVADSGVARDFDVASLRLDELTSQAASLRRALAKAPGDDKLAADLVICEAERLSVEGMLKL